ncbi:putative GPI anchored protein [Pseudocercospora fijiensis CIRAD86]|uniref:Putative GPI anchored protein n=1 Tax=Pseudocercospora fijiensis (strain CIRAD86) TaxID=383855 RepID=N1Q9B7_PSEFD|nr:putative GPI anchored protein [Pseudocercospora fijiensis CIRAD86]EME87483.1 putative GPI anchored protein [Pseudocercospora fijiensis CIRAD86]
MYFTRSLLIALGAAITAFAQGTGSQANPFNIPTTGLQATAGEPLTLSWKPTTSGTISLILRSGSSNNLAAGTVIASKIANTGSYTWTPDKDTTRGSDYTIEIVSDSDSSATNYTPYFVLQSDNTVAATTSNVTLGAPSSTLSLSTAAVTASPSAFPTTNMSGSMTTMTGTSSGSKTTETARASGSKSSASATGSATSAAGAARATVMAGMLGAVALGALVL